MKKILVPIIMILASLLGINIAYAIATPTTWMGDFSAQTLVPQAAYNSANVKGAYFTATSTTATSTFPIIRYGEVAVRHADGSYTSYPATTSSDVGRGTALLTACSGLSSGDECILGAGVFNIGNAYLDLSKGNTVASTSLRGQGKYRTTIKSSWLFSGQHGPAVETTQSSQVRDMTIWQTGTSINSAAIGNNNSNIHSSNVVLDHLNVIGYDSGIYYAVENASTSVTVYDTDVATKNFSIFFNSQNGNALGNFTMYGGTITTRNDGTANGGSESVGVLEEGGNMNFYGTVATSSGGTGDNKGFRINTEGVTGTMHLYGVKVYTTGPGASDLNNDTGTMYVDSNTIYDPSKVIGTLTTEQPVTTAGVANMTNSSGTSTFAGGLTIQSYRFVTNKTNGYVGIGVPTPAYPFQVGQNLSIPSAPASISSVQHYDNLAECLNASGDFVYVNVYADKVDPITGNYILSNSSQTSYGDDSSGNNYYNSYSWSSVSGAEGYWLEIDNADGSGTFDYWLNVGNVTSFAHDDGCRNDGNPSTESAINPAIVVNSANLVGIGRIPTTNSLEVTNNNSAAIDIYSAINTGGNNANGDIRILDPNNGHIMLKLGETSPQTGAAFMEQGFQTSANQILSEWDINNGSHTRSSGDARSVVLQGLTDTQKNDAQIVFAVADGGAGTPILMEMRGSLGRTAFSSTNLAYGANMGSTITDYGNLSVGSSYTNISAPPNGLIIQNNTGIGSSTPWAVLSVQATSSTQTGPLFAVASSTKQTDFVVTNSDLVGIGTISPDSTLDVNGSIRFEGNSRIVTGSISGAIVGLGCDLADTTSPVTLASTTVFVTTPKSYPGDGLTWQSYALNSTTIRTKLCSDVTVTPAASTYNVVIIR